MEEPESSSETNGDESSPVLAFFIVVASEGSSEEGDWENSRFELIVNWAELHTCSGEEDPEPTGDVFADR